MEWLVNWSVWHWVILGFVLLIAELMIPGVFLLWWGLALLITAGLMTFSSLSFNCADNYLCLACVVVKLDLVEIST